MRSAIIPAMTLLTMFAAGCSRDAHPTPMSAFHAQLDDDWKYWMTQYPETATAFGYPGQNARWTDYSPAAIDARAAYLKKSVERLAAIDRAQLDAGRSAELRPVSRSAGDGGATASSSTTTPCRSAASIPHNLLMPINQLEGIQQDIPRTFALMPAATREDYENIVVAPRRRCAGPSIRRSR